MSEKKVFLTQQLGGGESSRDPVDELIRLTAEWRRKRGLDDSHEHIQQSALAVFKANPELAKRYQRRPTTLAKTRPGADPWAKDGEED